MEFSGKIHDIFAPGDDLLEKKAASNATILPRKPYKIGAPCLPPFQLPRRLSLDLDSFVKKLSLSIDLLFAYWAIRSSLHQ